MKQLKENDQLNAVEEIGGPVPEIFLEYDQILKEGGKDWDDVNGGYLPQDLVLAVGREEIDWVHSGGVYEIVPMQECKDAGMKPLDRFFFTDKSVDPTRKENSIEVVCKRIQNEEARQDSTSSTQLLNCSLQCHFSKQCRCLSQS